MSEEVLLLFPEDSKEWKVVDIPLDRIASFAAPKLSPKFLKSIETDGQRVPVFLRKESDGFYTVPEGKRRVLALSTLGRQTVKAIVLPEGYNSAALTLITSQQRSPNPYADFEAIEDLLGTESFPTIEALAERVGMPLGTVTRLLRLKKLIVPLYNLARTGKISITIAFSASSLSLAEQGRLAEIYAEKSKLTADDLRDLKRARKLRSRTTLASLVESTDKRMDDANRLLRSALGIFDDIGAADQAAKLRKLLGA